MLLDVILEYNKKKYNCKWDILLPDDWEDKDVIFYWTEGNYCCDCNRSSLIKGYYKNFPELDCGENINLIKLGNIKFME